MAKKAMINKQQKTPKYSTRAYTRCQICGRPHAVLQKYGICRICFRELAYKGEIPGVKKSSWQEDIEMTDPIADMLTRIRNALVARHDEVEIPKSKIKEEIARILTEEGYINGYKVNDNTLVITLKYGPKNQKVISGIKRISKPGLRVYAPTENMPVVLGGMGIAILSTNKGIMTNKQAKAANVGGEVLAYVW